MDPALQVPFAAVARNITSGERTYHILTGSFRSVSLYLLALTIPAKEQSALGIASNSSNPTLSLVQSVPGFGPHQYLARNAAGDRVYTTSWANPPILSSWQVERDGEWAVKHLSNTPITATSSYLALSPSQKFTYSAGGPCGEVHEIAENGALGNKLQEFLFNGITHEELHSDKVDKSRKALRVGSHGVEFAIPPSDKPDAPTLAFIPHLTPSEIIIYTLDETSGKLNEVGKATVPQRQLPDGKLDVWENDGPRHVKIHPNGKVLYSVTEHSNYLDLYTITYTPTPSLAYHSSRSLIPTTRRSSESVHDYRGDTLILSPSHPRAIFASTRGATTKTKGYVLSVPLDSSGFFSAQQSEGEWWETPTSGGKANALDILPHESPSGVQDSSGKSWILLTDDDDAVATKGGAVRVLEWPGFGKGGLKEVVGWPGPGEEEFSREVQGGSHAIWLD